MRESPGELLWVAEARMLSFCGVTRTVLSGWDKAGLFERDPGGAYGLTATVEVVLLTDVREVFPLDDLVAVWKDMRRSGAAVELVQRACTTAARSRFDLVIDPNAGAISAAEDDDELLSAVRTTDLPRTVLVRPLAKRLDYATGAFERFATAAKRPSKRTAGRPPLVRRSAEVRSIRGDP